MNANRDTTKKYALEPLKKLQVLAFMKGSGCGYGSVAQFRDISAPDKLGRCWVRAYVCRKNESTPPPWEYTLTPPSPFNTLGPPATRHLKDVLMAGRWLSDLVCLLYTVHGGIGPFTFVRFRSLLLIKS